jgi:hypothetical protein
MNILDFFSMCCARWIHKQMCTCEECGTLTKRRDSLCEDCFDERELPKSRAHSLASIEGLVS